MSRRMKAVFTASVLLNILFIGLGAGMLYRFSGEVPIPPNMSPEARHFIARTYQEGREEIRPMIDEMKRERKVVEGIITAEKFDAAAYDEAVEKLLTTRSEIGQKRADIMGKALEELPSEDRREFAHRILESLEGKRPHKGGFHKKMMDRECDKPRGPDKGESKP
ncbi:MAG: hypothetical protein DI626_05355 [Micavibrio aeruginosavorus]|uniref:Periplasmic heavy metal sensor n=1 Tax=Micavibrio aeruginosavorus TaxID=349221 RepID=A0A2W4ZX51_9BACT|nr:MAG: hypothetical protein DI626_05355 [Micavibrio aeruginosavorus]